MAVAPQRNNASESRHTLVIFSGPRSPFNRISLSTNVRAARIRNRLLEIARSAHAHTGELEMGKFTHLSW